VPVTRNSAAGLAAFAVAVVVLAWALGGKPMPSDDRIVRVELQDVTTIGRFDRNVRVGGVNVGEIGDVQRGDGHAIVELRLRKDSVGTIHADATAELRPHTLFDGSAFIELDPGSASAPPLGDRRIPLRQTTAAVSLDKALRLFSSGLRRDLPRLTHDLRLTLLPDATRALHRTGRDAPRLFRALTPALRAAQGPTRDELADAVRGSARTAVALARAEADIGPALDAAAPTFAAVRAGDRSLDATLAALPGALRASASGGTALRRTVAELRPLARDVTPALRELGPALAELRPVARSARPVLVAARPFLADLRSVLATARRDAPAAAEVLRALLPVVRRVGDDLVPLLNERTPSGVSLVEALTGTVSGAAGILAFVSQSNGRGVGHGWHQSPSLLMATTTGCSSIPDETLRQRMRELGLCAD